VSVGRASKTRKAVAALGLLLTISGANGYAQDGAARPFAPEQVKRGAALYAKNCAACHGVRMRGPEWAIDLTQFPRDERSRFIDSVTNGKNTMPPWGDVLKPDDIASLWAYVVAGEPRQ
jgi:mono/diheme cytochrome c family protein